MRLLALIAMVCLTTLLFSVPLSDPDLWWHIVLGRWILAHQSLPTVDIWNQFSEPVPFVAYSWSNEIVYAYVEQRFGLSGLQILQTALGACLAASAAFIFFSLSRSPLASSLLLGASAFGLYPFFGLRPQAVSWLLFLWTIWLAERLLTRERKLPSFLALIGTFALWANSHITAVLGLGALALWLFPDPKSNQSPEPGAATSLSLLIKAVLCGILGTLLTPHLGREWLTFFSKSGHPFSHMFVQEFQPGTLDSFPTFALVVLFGGFVASLKLRHLRTNELGISRGQLISLALFLLGALAVQKFLPYALLLVGLLSAKALSKQSSENNWLVTTFDEEQRPRWPSSIGVLSAATLVLLLALGWQLPTAISIAEALHSPSAPIDAKRVPVAAMAFVQTHQLAGPLLHGFTDGGYVLYQRALPDGTVRDRVVIDGRTNVNSPEITRNFLSTLALTSTWHQFFDRTNPQTVLWENRFPLVPFLLERSEWCHIYPPPEVALTPNDWSVFVTRTQYENSLSYVPSRTCSSSK